MNTPTKNTSRVLRMLQEHSPQHQTYHPLTALLELSAGEGVSIGDQITIHKEIAKYCEPQLKQTEFKGASDAPPVTMRIIMDEAVDDGLSSK